MKLLTLDLDRGVPQPEATPETIDLYRLYDQVERAGERYGLNFGKKYGDIWGRMRLQIRDDRESLRGQTDWMQTVPFTVVSQKLSEVLCEFDCECEFLPLTAEYRKKVYEGKYFALNTLRVVRKAINLEKSQLSDYDEELGMAWGVERLTLLDGVLKDAPIAYLWEIGKHAVSNELAGRIRDGGIIGCRLLDPAAFTM